MSPASGFPLQFWLSGLALVLGALQAWNRRREAWGLPAMAVLGTVAVWYVGDSLYNDYELYYSVFGPEPLASAWWQVLLFVIAFCWLAPAVHQRFNRNYHQHGSQVIAYLETRRMEQPHVQHRITLAAKGLFAVWFVLMAVALVRVEGDVIGLFAPYLGRTVYPWGRNRIGAGMDAILSLATYVQIFVTAGAGVILAISQSPQVRRAALVICLLTLPGYIFDRTRNTMLATILPGLLAWVFFRLRGGIPLKIAVLGVAFLAADSWMSFVMANRSSRSIAAAMVNDDALSAGEGHHEGLNMFEELAWINLFMDQGTYKPNWGQRYFAEAVNPIPRVLWANKPMIGIDYALARGQGGGSDGSAGVYATISTGMIGQGVVNFGTVLGPLAAATLMAFWVALLARQDLLSEDPWRLLLYACGLILTFNLGRDITLLVVYPFLFGLIILKIWRYFNPETAFQAAPEPGDGGPPEREGTPGTLAPAGTLAPSGTLVPSGTLAPAGGGAVALAGGERPGR